MHYTINILLASFLDYIVDGFIHLGAIEYRFRTSRICRAVYVQDDYLLFVL